MDVTSDAQTGENWKKRHSPRSDHRSRSHDSAHAEGEHSSAEHKTMEHPLVPRGEAALITSDDGLSRLIQRLRTIGSFAYDSEFIGELTYFPKLCLIQVASREEIALIDPLANLSLTPFWELLRDPAVEK